MTGYTYMNHGNPFSSSVASFLLAYAVLNITITIKVFVTFCNEMNKPQRIKLFIIIN